MIILALVVLIGLVLIGLAIHDDSREWGFTLFAGLLGTILSVVLVGLLMQIPVHIFTENDDHKEYQGSFDIIAAADGSVTEGHFFIFGGQIEEKPMYFFYRQNANGAITQGHIPVEETIIYEDQESRGYVEIYEDDDIATPAYFYMADGNRKYEIHVPKGAVVRQFNFDLEK